MGQVNDIALSKALYSKSGAKYSSDFGLANAFSDHAREAGIEDGGGSSTLHNHQVLRFHPVSFVNAVPK
jgi:hypothetical protein